MYEQPSESTQLHAADGDRAEKSVGSISASHITSSHRGQHRFLSSLVQWLYLLTFPLLGITVAYIGFCDPDICWHLALGQWMVQHGTLPSIDPFCANIHDFVFVGNNFPLIQHEWLSDIILFRVYQIAGAAGLLVMTATLAIISLLLIPLSLMRKNRVPQMLSMAFCSLMALSSAFRLWVRPEQVSFLCMSVLIALNQACQSATRRGAAIYIAAVYLLMTFWVNCHAIFVVGLAYLAGYYGLCLLESLVSRKETTNFARGAILLTAAICGTLNTPWHFHFWQYIAKLISSPITYANKENGALIFSPGHLATLLPLLGAIALFWWNCYSRISKEGRKPARYLLPIGLGLFATVSALAVMRLAPIALLVLASALAIVYRRTTVDILATTALPETKLLRIPGYALGVIACAGACFSASSFLIPPAIPSTSQYFTPPIGAIRFLEQNPLDGNILNDSKFGSMMLWNMSRPPEVFIDGRLDSMDRQIVTDYLKMRNCKGNWKELLDRYRISYVFFPPNAPLIFKLLDTKQWSLYYADRNGIILQRSNGVPQ